MTQKMEGFHRFPPFPASLSLWVQVKTLAPQQGGQSVRARAIPPCLKHKNMFGWRESWSFFLNKMIHFYPFPIIRIGWRKEHLFGKASLFHCKKSRFPVTFRLETACLNPRFVASRSSMI
jgi:hypothetical protein